jgi:hypothetical protein
MADGLKQLNKFIERLENIGTFLQDESDKYIGTNSKVLVEQNLIQMKEEGKTFTDEEIRYLKSRKSPIGSRGAYSASYEKYKGNRGGTVDYVDLFLTGQFHKSISLIQFNPGEWRFVSDDEKIPFLLSNYGSDILGINEESLDIFSVAMEKNLQERTDKHLDV